MSDRGWHDTQTEREEERCPQGDEIGPKVRGEREEEGGEIQTFSHAEIKATQTSNASHSPG